MTGPRYWVVTASSDHAARGRTEGIVQACHGKVAPLRRMKPGDGVVIYSPQTAMRGGQPVQAFTAVGRVRDELPYVFDMGGGFTPWRRDVDWFAAEPAPIQPLLPLLSFTAGRQNWGYVLRFGLFEVPAADMELIGRAMRAAEIGAAPAA